MNAGGAAPNRRRARRQTALVLHHGPCVYAVRLLVVFVEEANRFVGHHLHFSSDG